MPSSASLFSRRRILAAAGAAASAFSLPVRARAAEPAQSAEGWRMLHARIGSVAGPYGTKTDVRGFEGSAPGPLLRVRQGEELRVRLLNALAAPIAIHWHGVRAPSPMDGAPGLSQSAVAPGSGFDYRFRPPDAGTFCYHAPWLMTAAEAGTVEGLSGALIVDEPVPPGVDGDHVLVFEDWQTSPADKPHWIANGSATCDLPVRANERIRLRLINGAHARVLSLRLDRHAATVMALDGQPAEPFEARASRLTLAPGNTADVFVDATLAGGQTAAILVASAQGELPLARLVYADDAPTRPAPLPPPQPLPANPLPARLDFRSAVRADLSLDAFPQVAASLQAQAPRFRVRRGRTVMLALINRGDFACAVHVHGHVFRLLDRLDDGWKPFWLHTLLIGAGQSARIAFLADNPGKWLIESVAIDRPEDTRAAWFEVA
jgi:FtsP/CotA-like multicopper oxidase with cupredoxin domain